MFSHVRILSILRLISLATSNQSDQCDYPQGITYICRTIVEQKSCSLCVIA